MPPPLTAVLAVTATSVSFTWPALRRRMAPPLAVDFPWARVTPESSRA